MLSFSDMIGVKAVLILHKKFSEFVISLKLDEKFYRTLKSFRDPIYTLYTVPHIYCTVIRYVGIS